MLIAEHMYAENPPVLRRVAILHRSRLPLKLIGKDSTSIADPNAVIESEKDFVLVQCNLFLFLSIVYSH